MTDPEVKVLMLKGDKGDGLTADDMSRVKMLVGDSVADAKDSISDSLNSRIDNLIVPSGKESSAEVVDARLGSDGKVYDTLGTAIRTQDSMLAKSITSVLFDNNNTTFESGKVLNKKGEVISGPAAYGVSELIECSFFGAISIDYMYFGDATSYLQIAYYDFDKNFIGGYSANGSGYLSDLTSDVPINAKFMRLSCDDKKFIFHAANLRLPIDNTLNLFGKSSLSVPNKYISSDGVIRDVGAPQYRISEYINCTTFRELNIVEAYLAKGNLLIAFYDKNKNFLSGVKSTGGLQKNVDVVVPSNAFYMILSSSVTDSNYSLSITKVGISSNIYNLTSILNDKAVTLIGDSITAGQGSSTYVSWSETKDGVNYVFRGNAPDKPNAEEDYQVGELLLQDGTWSWYESISANGYAQKLKKYLTEKFNCTVHNRACAGINSETMLANYKRWTEDSDIVFIMIGTNNRSTTTKNKFYTDLCEIVRGLLAKGKIPVLLSSIPATNENETGKPYHMEDVAININKVAEMFGVIHYSFFNDIQRYCNEKNIELSSLLADGLHPNDKGYEVMYRLLCYGLDIPLKIEHATW